MVWRLFVCPVCLSVTHFSNIDVVHFNVNASMDSLTGSTIGERGQRTFQPCQEGRCICLLRTCTNFRILNIILVASYA